jgi:hypothetical protein
MPRESVRSILTSSLVVGVFATVALTPLFGQNPSSCPDWSPLFNQIKGSAMLQTLQSERAAGWPQLASALSNPGPTFAQGNQIIAMAQSRIQSDRQGLQQLSSGNVGPVNDRICSSNSGSASLALACDLQESQDLILATEGTLQLIQCRTGFNGAIGTGGLASVPGTTSSNAKTSDLLGALLKPSNSVPLASQSDFQNFENKIANSAVVGDAAGTEQADASANASQLASGDKSSDPMNAEVDSILSASGNSDNSQAGSVAVNPESQVSGDSDWKDPVAAASDSQQQPQSNASVSSGSSGDDGKWATQAQTNPAQPVGTADDSQSPDNNLIDGSKATPPISSPTDAAANVASQTIGSQTSGATTDGDSTSGSALSTGNQDLAADLLKRGISSTGELGEAAVQSFDNAQGWKKLYSSNADDQINGITQLASGANDAFNTNEISKAVGGQLIPVIGSFYSQGFNILGTANNALAGNVAPNELNNQLDNFLQSPGKALFPGLQTVQQDIQNAQSNISHGINSGFQYFQNLFSSKTQCSPFADCQ